MFRKVYCFILAATMSLGVITTPVYAETESGNEETDTIQEQDSSSESDELTNKEETETQDIEEESETESETIETITEESEEEPDDLSLEKEDDEPVKEEETEEISLRAVNATAPTELWIEPSETNGIPSRIDVFKANTGSTYYPTYTYQIYLPGNADVENCFLSWDSDMSATVNGSLCESGTCPIPGVNETVTYSFKNGNQTLASYNIITYQGSNNDKVQRVFIEIDESGDNKTIAQMDGDANHNTECTGRININGQWYDMPKIKGRGNVSWEQADDKRPYNITLGSKINFPGVDSPKTKKWTFLAEILDHSLLCNRSGFYLAHAMEIGQSTTSADVWMNGEYQGCYTVTPKTDSYVTDDGFMIEEDNYKEKSVAEGGDPQFTLEGLKEASGWSSCYNRITVKKMGDNLLKVNGEVDKSSENLETVANNTIKPWLQDAWNAIRSDDGYNSKGKKYTDYIDIESFAKMYLMHEYVKSYDVCAGSILFYRDGQTDNDKLKAGPLWDLDNAMGSVYQNGSLGNADDRTHGDRRSGEGIFIANVNEYKTSIYKTLGKHEEFMQEVRHQYNKYRNAFNHLPDDTDTMINDISASAAMNHLKVNELSHNNHKYNKNTTLGTGVYRQTYLATTNSKSDWANYAANLKTYITTRSLWFKNNYWDDNYVDPADCEHEYQETAVIQELSCLQDGIIEYYCPICKDRKTVTTPKIAHDYQDGICSMCGEHLITVTIDCGGGASVTVYETKIFDGAHIENAETANPRDGDTGRIDCSGDAQINFKVILEPGYELVSVTASPKNYKNLKGEDETNVPNGYRITKVSDDFTISVLVSGHVTFDANGGTGQMENQTINTGVETELNENTFTREHYTFTGWNTARDGSGTSYDDKALVTLNENTTLYAQWRIDTFAVTFDADNGTEQVMQSVNAGGYAEKPENDPVKENYRFLGWYLVIDPDTGETASTAFDFENTPITEDITLKAVWIPANAIQGRSASLLLKGSIIVQFKVNVPDPENTKVVITYKGKETKYPATEGELDTYTDGSEIYKYKVPVSAKEMRELIRIEFEDNYGNKLPLYKGINEAPDGITYSVTDYIESMQDSDNTKLKEMLSAMQLYGEWCQKEFKYKADEVNPAEVEGVELSDLEGYQRVVTGTYPSGIKIKATSLLLESETTVQFKLQVLEGEIGDFTVKIDGEEIEPEEETKTGLWLAKKRNIVAKNLDEMVTIEISKDGEDNVYTAKYGPMTYAYNKLQGDSSNSLKNLCKAMYKYNEKAKIYFGK